jgi:hypothetical protein
MRTNEVQSKQYDTRSGCAKLLIRLPTQLFLADRPPPGFVLLLLLGLSEPSTYLFPRFAPLYLLRAAVVLVPINLTPVDTLSLSVHPTWSTLLKKRDLLP